MGTSGGVESLGSMKGSIFLPCWTNISSSKTLIHTVISVILKNFQLNKSLKWSVFNAIQGQITTLYGQGLNPSRDIFLLSTASRLAVGPPSFVSNAYWRQYPLGVKWARPWSQHSPPHSAKVKNGEDIPPLSHMSSWHSAYLIKYRNNFTFTL
jgi:hypothetical protein